MTGRRRQRRRRFWDRFRSDISIRQFVSISAKEFEVGKSENEKRIGGKMLANEGMSGWVFSGNVVPILEKKEMEDDYFRTLY